MYGATRSVYVMNPDGTVVRERVPERDSVVLERDYRGKITAERPMGNYPTKNPPDFFISINPDGTVTRGRPQFFDTKGFFRR